MAYSACQVANAFLDIAAEHGQPLTNMKLQKLLYYTQGWYLANFSKPLIDEQVEAWKFGPVFASAYQKFKRYGSGPISEKATDVVRAPSGVGYVCAEIPDIEDADVLAFLQAVWHAYGNFTAIELSQMTHDPETPWGKIRRQWDSLPYHTDIPIDDIETHFKEQLQASQTAQQEHPQEAAEAR